MEGTFVTGYRLTEYPGGPTLSLAGQFNQGNEPVTRYQHLLTLDWSYQNWGAGLNNHFTEHYHDYSPDAAGNIITAELAGRLESDYFEFDRPDLLRQNNVPVLIWR